MNSVNLIGRVTRQPELRFAAGTGKAIARFSIAVNRYMGKDKEDDADFINCVVWGKKAENLAQTVNKGTQLGINGNIKTGKYEKDGITRYTTEVWVDNYYYCGKKNNETITNEKDSFNEGFDDNMTPIDDENHPF